MSEPAHPRDESDALYVGWDELHRRVAPKLGRDRFRAVVKDKLDRAGFPPFREEWGGFYWPRVRQWLDSHNGVGNHAGSFVATPEDGPENFDAPPRKKARVQARPSPAAVLDRQAGEPERDRLPGSVHPFTPRRR